MRFAWPLVHDAIDSAPGQGGLRATATGVSTSTNTVIDDRKSKGSLVLREPSADKPQVSLRCRIALDTEELCQDPSATPVSSQDAPAHKRTCLRSRTKIDGDDSDGNVRRCFPRRTTRCGTGKRLRKETKVTDELRPTSGTLVSSGRRQAKAAVRARRNSPIDTPSDHVKRRRRETRARPTVSFETRVTELETWVSSHDEALPSSFGKPDERKLLSFLSETRKKYKQKELSEAQIRQLSRVPGMQERIRRWQGGASAPFGQAPFAARVDELEAWIQQHQRLPSRKRKGADSGEIRLADFLTKMLKKDLADERREHLLRVPGVSARLRKRQLHENAQRPTFEENVAGLKAWVQSHENRLPVRDGVFRGAERLESQRLGRFLSQQQQHHRKGRLWPEMRRRLSEVPGMAERLAQWDDRIDGDQDEM